MRVAYASSTNIMLPTCLLETASMIRTVLPQSTFSMNEEKYHYIHYIFVREVIANCAYEGNRQQLPRVWFDVVY